MEFPFTVFLVLFNPILQEYSTHQGFRIWELAQISEVPELFIRWTLSNAKLVDGAKFTKKITSCYAAMAQSSPPETANSIKAEMPKRVKIALTF